MSEGPLTTGEGAEQEDTQTVWPPAPRLPPPPQRHRPQRRGWRLRWTVFFFLFITVDVYHSIVRHKPLTVETVVFSLIWAAVFGWFSTLSPDASGVGFLAWVAASVLTFVAQIKIGKSIHLSPQAATALTYADEYLPLLIALGAVSFWLQWKDKKDESP